MSGSLGYAERLTHRIDLGGQLGADEHLDSVEIIAQKSIQLAALLKLAKESGRGCVVHTGAGISTSCDIPDFRGMF